MNNGEHKSDWFLKMNPAHKVPVLKDGKQKDPIDFDDASRPHQYHCGQITTGPAFIFC